MGEQHQLSSESRSLTGRGPVTSEDLGRNDVEQDFASSGQSLVLSLLR